MYSYAIAGTSVKLIFRLLRPYQWSKNILIFSGLVFSGSLLNYSKITTVLIAFVVFCLISSSVYISNDLTDIEQDKRHPEKSKRPLASGQIKVQLAFIILSFLLISGLTMAYLFLNTKFLFVLLSYIILNIFYSFGLKKIVILDVMLISIGFLMRAVAGCVIINVQASSWLYLCTLSLAAFMSFGKRRNEIAVLGIEASKHRLNLQLYSIYFLDLMMTICATAAILTYSLYTMNYVTYHYKLVKLTYTIPFVMFSVFRYFFLVQQSNDGGDPTKLLMHDFPSIISGVLWIISVVSIIYFHEILEQIVFKIF